MGQAVLFNMRQDLDILTPGSRYSNVRSCSSLPFSEFCADDVHYLDFHDLLVS